MLSLNSQPNQNDTSPVEKQFSHKLRTTLPSLIHLRKVPPLKRILLPKTWNVNCLKLFQEQQCKFKPTNKTSGTKEVLLWVKIIAHDCTIFWTREENILARNCHQLISATKKINIQHDCDNAIPVSSKSTHPNLTIDNLHEKPTLEVSMYS